MKIKLGILMEGGEDQFIRQVVNAMSRHENACYVEVGVAYAETLLGVWSAIRMIPNSRAIGIELPEWSSWDSITGRMESFSEFSVDDISSRATVLRGKSVDVLGRVDFPKISCAFIDACHGLPCVKADFQAVEKHCQPGSVVIFHDAGEREQGFDMQPHCRMPISVRAGLAELGLVNGTRSGWAQLPKIPTANECAVFEYAP